MTHHQAETPSETAWLWLRRFESCDAPAIAAALNDQQTCQGLAVVPFPHTLEDAQQFIDDGSSRSCAICRDDKTLVGCITLIHSRSRRRDVPGRTVLLSKTRWQVRT